MKNYLRKLLFPGFIVLLVAVFFFPFIIKGLIPIPADTILGLYHPWRDVVWNGFTAGVPYKNFLITDPVRQQYAWRKLAIDEIKQGRMPSWNPYSFSGTPLLANFQTAAFYPLNILFFIVPFHWAWGIQVVMQLLIGGCSFYLFLRARKISYGGSTIASLAFIFSGFSIAWLEWNTVVHTLAWLPLLLLCIEKIAKEYKSTKSFKSLKWAGLFVFGLCTSFLAGHLQVFFYVFLTTLFYIAAKLLTMQIGKRRIILLFVICFLLFAGLTSIQWIPTLRFIASSAREFDQGSYLKEGWFIPWQNLVQFVAPDFFGNPTTGNYWGVWNYGEFVGYVGIIPLIFALYALIFRKGKATVFFGSLFFASLIFAFPTVIAKLPYIFKIPLVSTSQPTRLLSLTVFSLAALSGLGFEQWTKDKNIKRVIISGFIPFITVFCGWIVIFCSRSLGLGLEPLDLLVSRKNLILPTLIYTVSIILLMLGTRVVFRRFGLIYFFVVILLVTDLFRFGWKFTPFSKSDWVFPSTQITQFIEKNAYPWRIMASDRRIMAPNFSMVYGISDVSGYDPLYLRSYGEMVAAWGRGSTDISAASFNRILTPDNYESFMANLLGVKYVLTLTPLTSVKLKYITNEGQTQVYENKDVFPRAFFVYKLIRVQSKKQEMEEMYKLADALRTTAVTSDEIPVQTYVEDEKGTVEIISHKPSNVLLKTNSNEQRLLVLTDIYYPTWQVTIDGQKSAIYRVDFALRAVVVPAGLHTVEFRNSIL